MRENGSRSRDGFRDAPPLGRQPPQGGKVSDTTTPGSAFGLSERTTGIDQQGFPFFGCVSGGDFSDDREVLVSDGIEAWVFEYRPAFCL